MKTMSLGAIPNPPDSRDYILASYIPISLEIPTVVSYEAGMTPVKYQAELGSCVAFATSAMKEFYDSKEFGKSMDLSEQALYGMCKAIDGYDGEGTYPRAAMEVLLRIGEPEEQYLPYEGRYPPRKTLAQGWEDNAARFRIKAYASVGTDVDSMKRALALNGPIGISVMVYENFYKPINGVIQMPSGAKEGGHMMCAVGYDDHRQAFRVKNSWDTWWGDKGYCWIPYVVWNKIGMGAMSIVDLTLTKKPWFDWPEEMSEEDTEAAYATKNKGWMLGYPNGDFNPWGKMLKRHVALVAERAGLPFDKDLKDDWSPATRGWVRDTFPGLDWKEERWDEEISRIQVCILIGRKILSGENFV